MKNIIEYFYNIEVEKITYQENKFYILNEEKTYIFKEIKNIDINILNETQKYKCFHTIIYNKNKELITIYETKGYILLKCNIKDNRKVSFNDILKISSIKVWCNNNYKTDYKILWAKKIDNFEKYIKNKNSSELPYREYYDYYIGLSEVAIEYIKNLKTDNIRYGFSYKRIKEDDTLFEILDPTNIIIAPIIRNISEYFKKTENFNIELINNVKLTYDECVLFIGRLLFPTYFFDICHEEKNSMEKSIKKIINNFSKMEKNIYYLINYLKKRGYNIPNIDWLKN